jgi:ribosomal protein S18 acetylase RimI-like enzyme
MGDFLHSTALGKKYFPRVEDARLAIGTAQGHDGLFAVLDDDRPLALLWYKPKGAFGLFPYLHIIVVAAESQGQGIGSDLLTFFEWRALRQDNRVLLRNKTFLLVDEENKSAKRLYTNRGYCQVGAVDGLFRNGVCEAVMMRAVSCRDAVFGLGRVVDHSDGLPALRTILVDNEGACDD